MPGGRPSYIDTVVGQREDGSPVTVAERIVNGIAIGMYLEPAIIATGIGKSTAYGWLHTAGLALIRTNGNLDDPSLTDHERKCIEFSDAVEQATATWEASKLGVLETLERGGIPQVTTTVKIAIDADGNEREIERTTRTEHTLPDARVILWRLRHRIPTRYQEKLAITGADGGPLAITMEDRANALADSLLAHQETIAASGELGGNGRRRPRGNGSSSNGEH